MSTQKEYLEEYCNLHYHFSEYFVQKIFLIDLSLGVYLLNFD